MVLLRGVAAAVAASGFLALAAAANADAAGPPADRFDTVVIDAGHGGEDEGARGPAGHLEKNLVLDVALLLSARLRATGLRVVLTRRTDTYVPLETRTAIANDARGDLFLSIHANAVRDSEVRGTETFFLSLEASDEYARQVALRENAAFRGPSQRGAPVDDPLVAILGDLIANEHSRESNEFARLAQARLGRLDPDASRGVKQAPFVVLTGVQMPASLVEIGFITNRGDERDLHSRRGRERIVAALAGAVRDFARRYDARRGVAVGAPARAR
ncbi:MAG: N-acetylmuramoyl-L-alanine amidase [Myxococcales bacterium]|nr:N-acetylmuramoyl-L-alanine amidase [Myxococcales bacterium]